MSKSESTEREDGAPIPKDAVDPELVKLARTRSQVGIITAVGILLLCGYFLIKLGPDRHFAGEPDRPSAVTVGQVLDGTAGIDDHVVIETDPVFAHAIRTVKNKGDVGLRIVPVRGAGDHLWLALPGDGWDEPVTERKFAGRLRRLDDLTFAGAVRTHAAENARPVFATAAEVRAGAATGKVKTITGEVVDIAATDKVVYEVVDPNASVVIASITERHPKQATWLAAFERAGFPKDAVAIAAPEEVDEAFGQLRFDIKLPVAETTKKLADAELFATRVEPVTIHEVLAWSELAQAGPDPRADLVGIYARRAIPDDAIVLIGGETPQDYWYVKPISIVLLLIGLLFGWALVRAVRRDLLPARA